MNKFKLYLFSIVLFLNLQSNSISQNIPNSFADLAERLMPSVVNISTTTTITMAKTTTMNAAAVELAGTRLLKILNMVENF